MQLQSQSSKYEKPHVHHNTNPYDQKMRHQSSNESEISPSRILNNSVQGSNNMNHMQSQQQQNAPKLLSSEQKSFSQNQNGGSFLKQDSDISNPHQQILSEINNHSPVVQEAYGSSSQNHVSQFQATPVSKSNVTVCHDM